MAYGMTGRQYFFWETIYEYCGGRERVVEDEAHKNYHHKNISFLAVNSSFAVDDVFTIVQEQMQAFVEAEVSADLPVVVPEFAEFGVPIPGIALSDPLLQPQQGVSSRSVDQPEKFSSLGPRTSIRSNKGVSQFTPKSIAAPVIQASVSMFLLAGSVFVIFNTVVLGNHKADKTTTCGAGRHPASQPGSYIWVGVSNYTTGSTLGKLGERGTKGQWRKSLALGGGREESYTTWNDNPDSERAYFDSLTRG